MRERIDWEIVRRRLAESEVRLSEALVPVGERAEGVLNARAARLATRAADFSAAAEHPEFLVCRAGGALVGLAVAQITGIVPFAGATPVPGVAPPFRGAAAVRGEIVAVAELDSLLQCNSEHPGEGYLLLLGSPANTALRVDAVLEMRRVNLGALRTGSTPSLASGLTDDGVLILDPQAVALRLC